jgi:formylglycine-generating enzyme required for sulfatase activity
MKTVVASIASASFALLAGGLSASVANDAMTNDPQVVMTSLSARQRYPWNGKVDIDFSFTSAIPEAFAFIQFKATYVDKAGATVEVPMKTFDQVTLPWCTNAGAYRVTWDSTADAPNLHVTNLQYTVTANMAKYMVVNLSRGTSATADDPYTITYLEECPDPTRMDGGWTDYDKTTNMVFRLVQPGTYMQAWSDDSSSTECRRSAYRHSATITKPFYIAIFELTQGQMYLLKESYGQSGVFTGGNRKARPTLETYQNIRGKGYQGTINWPVTGSEVTSGSLLGLLRTRTNTDGWDIPTESEWEYVCRSGGQASGFWNDGSDSGISSKTKYSTVSKTGPVAVLDPLGRYKYNGGFVATYDEEGGTNIYTSAATSSDETHGTAVVGSYKPNVWGIYDMHGNVAEWCNGSVPGTYFGWSSGSDYYEQCRNEYPNLVDDLGPVTDPWGQWYARSHRGGSWSSSAYECITSRRGTDYERGTAGVRLVWRFPTPAQAQE